MIAILPNVDNKVSRGSPESPWHQIGFFYGYENAVHWRRGMATPFSCVFLRMEKDGHPANDSMGILYGNFFSLWNFRCHKGALMWVVYGLQTFFTHLTLTTHSHSYFANNDMPSTWSSKAKTQSGHLCNPLPPASTASTAHKRATSSVAENTFTKKTKVDDETMENQMGKGEKKGKKDR